MTTTMHADTADVNSEGRSGASFKPEYGEKNGPRQGNSNKSHLSIEPTEIRDFLQALDADNEPPCDGLFASFDDNHDRAEAQDEYIWQPHVQAMKAELRKKEDALKADPKNAQLQEEVAGLKRGWAEIEQDMPGHFVQHKFGPVNGGMITWMRARQNSGCGIFLTIQAMQAEEGKKPKRLKKNFAYGRAVFVEDDTPRLNGPRTDFPLPPSWINKSSETEKGAKYHYYWFIQFSTAFDRDTIEAIQRRMAEPVEKGGWGSDPACIDAARVMRMPGTWNLKAGRPPFLVKALEKNGKRYTAQEILAAFPPIVIEKPKPRTDRFSAKGELERFTEPGNPLERISSDEEYVWMQVGWALHYESGGSGDGLRIWDDWSSTSTKYREGECARKWAGMNCGGGITGGVIYALAKDAGWRREDLEEQRERTKAREGKGKKAKNPHREKSSQKAKGDDHAEAKSPPPPGGGEPPAGDADEGPERPTIIVTAGDLHPIATEAMEMLVAAGANIYQRGGKLVRPISLKGIDSKGRSVYTTSLVEVERTFMRDMLCRFIEWRKHDARVKTGDGTRRIDAPEEIARIIMGRTGHWIFRTIAGVISTPTLRHDGSILSEPGYDDRTGLFLESHVALPAISDAPTQEEAAAALAIMKGLLVEFPFVFNEEEFATNTQMQSKDKNPSLSVALSSILTVIARGMIDVAPAHGARAPSPGTGKSYLSDVAAAIALGQRCPVISVSADNDGETEKRIITMAMSGEPIISLDNVNGVLGGDTLCQLIERPTCNLRILGKTERMKIENRVCVFFNGNNVRTLGDMNRRVIISDLDRKMENPETYEFQGDPVREVLADRGKYIAAAMTIIKAYIAAGKPKQNVKPLNSFEEWSQMIRSPLIWLGEADPCDTIKAAKAEDPQAQAAIEFIAAAKPHMNGQYRALKSGEIAKLASEGNSAFGGGDWNPAHPELHAILSDLGRGRIPTGKRIGDWLRTFKNRIYDGLRVVSIEDKKSHQQKWFIEEVALA